MARKSRKNMMPQAAVQEAVQQNEKELLRTAAYARLSVENGGHETEDSLHTQILQIHNYIRENPELTLTDTYADNGFTGTRFDRPEFERMMQDVRTGKIQCIVVKDLSRFGRDYIETGSYLETIFPMLHVRFIAINDEFDNIRQSDVDSLAVPIKNMVNSLYAKDISKKISLSYQMRREKGIPTSWCTPYGYQLNQQGNKFEATEDAKWVKLIYQWYLAGVSTNEIARRLEFLEVARPNERLNRKLHEGDDPTYNKWHPSTVLRILNSSAYIGELVSGKTQTASYKGIGLHPVEKKKWHIVENAHEAIILKSDFEKVQARREQNKEKRERAMARSKATREKCYNHLSGMVYCGCCRRNMTFERRVHGTVKETHYGVFICKRKKNTTPCAYHAVPEKMLMMVAMDQIHHLVSTMCEEEKLVKDMMRGSNLDSARSIKMKENSMNELNLPTPGLYAKRKNLLMGSNPIIAPDSEMLWNAAIVWRILRRYEYTGALVMGRRKKIDVNTTSVRTLPEDKWIIAENAHAAIVTKDEYYQAQKAIRNVTPIQYKVGDDFALKGKICCGNCNRQLRHERQYGEMVFYCGYKRSAGKFSKCYGGYYREYSVNAKVARAIKTVFYALDVVNQGMQEKQSITVRCMDIEDLEKQAEAIRVEQIKLYESYADGVLLRDAYIEKKKALSEKLAALQDSIRTEKEEQECADELDEEIRALTKQASEKTYIGGLTKECVDAFVSMVYLYDDQTMKIEFNCEDVIRRALEKYGA